MTYADSMREARMRTIRAESIQMATDRGVVAGITRFVYLLRAYDMTRTHSVIPYLLKDLEQNDIPTLAGFVGIVDGSY